MSRAAATALVAVLFLSGCGSAQDVRRHAVNAYIANVNHVEQSAAYSWNRTRDAYLNLGHGRVTARQLRALAAAPRVIRSLRVRIAAVPAPAEARRLRTSILRLLDLDASFAAEVSLLQHYVHDVGPLEARVARATKQLRRALQGKRASGPERRALSRYAGQLDAVVARLRRLHPPQALAPWHTQQSARVDTLLAGARELAAGLARHDPSRVRRGLTALTGAAVGSPVTSADRAAIVAYNGRLKRIEAASAAVAREEHRLARKLT